MTIYVDEPIHAYGRMKMCHMASPNITELHAMADKIGVARRWFQDPLTMKVSRPHYDIAKSKRALAIAAGAVAIDRYQMVVVTNAAMYAHLTAAEKFEAAHIWRDPFRQFRGEGNKRLAGLEAWWSNEAAIRYF